MNLEELQVIWNTQEQRPLFSLDEAGVLATLRRERQAARRKWYRWHILTAYVAGGAWTALVAVNLLVALSSDANVSTRMGWEAVSMLIVAAVLLAWFLFTTFRARSMEREREDTMSGSVREEVDRGIAQIEHQIRAEKNVFRASLPMLMGVCLTVWAMTRLSGPAWPIGFVGAFVLLSIPLEIRRCRRVLTRELLPRKRTLESLRAKLTNPLA
jgi:hypothetical protein